MADDLLAPGTLSRRGLVDPAAVEQMRRANAAGHGDYAIQIYGLLSLELWAQTFLDRTWRFDRLAAEQQEVARVA